MLILGVVSAIWRVQVPRRPRCFVAAEEPFSIVQCEWFLRCPLPLIALISFPPLQTMASDSGLRMKHKVKVLEQGTVDLPGQLHPRSTGSALLTPLLRRTRHSRVHSQDAARPRHRAGCPDPRFAIVFCALMGFGLVPRNMRPAPRQDGQPIGSGRSSALTCRILELRLKRIGALTNVWCR